MRISLLTAIVMLLLGFAWGELFNYPHTIIEMLFNTDSDRLADFSFDTAISVSRFATIGSFVITAYLLVAFRKKGKAKSRKWLNIALLALVPTFFHALGIFLINNYGAIGGGL